MRSTVSLRVAWLVAAIALGACAPAEGSGVERDEARAVPAFDGVHVADGIRAEVRADGVQELRVVTDDDLWELITTTVDDGALRLRTEGPIEPTIGPTVTVGVEALAFLSARGDETSALAVGVDADRFGVAASDGAAVEAEGRCDRLVLVASGEGRAALSSLACRTVSVDVQGGAEVAVSATERVEIRASGGSVIRVTGGATIDEVFVEDAEIVAE
ncbi:MAG TPA: DUF2807 domain-containing protein [Sandaracinaceae bacterium LLY-WYZ-13_1]|nr:DUF2807 domain-containing protein [Sandaracinaceae bacterium LLY-WYZ-13_1]